MLVSTKSLDINIDFWGFDINLKVFLGTKLALWRPFSHACCVLVLLPGVVYYMGVQFEKRGQKASKAPKMRKEFAQRAASYYIDLPSLPSQLAQVRTVGPRSDVLRSLPSTALGFFASCVLINFQFPISNFQQEGQAGWRFKWSTHS